MLTEIITKKDHSIQSLPCLTLSQRQLCDLELILNGGFAPLSGFLTEKDYQSVLHNMSLTDGTIWPMPIMLDVEKKFAEKIKIGDELVLQDNTGLSIGVIKIEDMWLIDKAQEAQAIYGTHDPNHPGVAYLLHQVKDIYLGGQVRKVSLPYHEDFHHLRYTPDSLKQLFVERGWKKIVAFQTRNPMHRAHQELTLRAAEQTGANLLLHPVVGQTKPGDIEYRTRVRCYEHLISTYPSGLVILSLLPLAMRMAGPREAVWHAIIRKNYGCTHFIVGRDHAGPGKDSQGKNFYDPYKAQELALHYQKQIGMEIVPFQEMAFSQKQSRYFPLDQFPKDETPSTISGTELREKLSKNLPIPEWFSYPTVINELRKSSSTQKENDQSFFNHFF